MEREGVGACWLGRGKSDIRDGAFGVYVYREATDACIARRSDGGYIGGCLERFNLSILSCCRIFSLYENKFRLLYKQWTIFIRGEVWSPA
jgi:hypothetical protein